MTFPHFCSELFKMQTTSWVCESLNRVYVAMTPGSKPWGSIAQSHGGEGTPSSTSLTGTLASCLADMTQSWVTSTRRQILLRCRWWTVIVRLPKVMVPPAKSHLAPCFSSNRFPTRTHGPFCKRNHCITENIKVCLIGCEKRIAWGGQAHIGHQVMCNDRTLATTV